MSESNIYEYPVEWHRTGSVEFDTENNTVTAPGTVYKFNELDVYQPTKGFLVYDLIEIADAITAAFDKKLRILAIKMKALHVFMEMYKNDIRYRPGNTEFQKAESRFSQNALTLSISCVDSETIAWTI